MPLGCRMSSVLLALGVILASCSPSPSARIARADVPRESQPDVAPSRIAELTAGNEAFAFDLYRSLRSQAGNLVFSPFSISMALAMPYAGARGTTEAQMGQVLHFDLPQGTLPAAFNQLDLALTQRGQTSASTAQPMQLEIANSAWADQTISFLPAFLDVLARNYGAGIQLADFIHQSEAARQQINAWVAQETQQKIQNLISPGALGSDSRFVLVNAIYFKADWQTQFDPNNTKPEDFMLVDGTQVQVPTMSNSTITAPYMKGHDYQAVELPYAGGTAVMDLILPDAGTFSDFESRLDAPALDQIISGMQPASLDLHLPRFKFGAAFDLGEHLSQMGMTDAFDPNRADFSGMTGSPDLFVSKVLHEAQVAVDEKGTEAAAATAVIMAPTSILQDTIPVKFDRPFVFVIRDVASGQVLFLGRVLDPTQH